ncbi:putative toxin [Nocardioides ultimimeridianus]
MRSHSPRERTIKYRHKFVRTRPSRQDDVQREWQDKGWELHKVLEGRLRNELIFRRERASRLWLRLTAVAVVAVLAIVAVVATHPGLIGQGHTNAAKSDAAAALNALRAGDLAGLDDDLAARRGEPAFAYYFASQATPRQLGDALSTVVDAGGDTPLKQGIDPQAYEITLVDLAGVLALATHGTGRWALPASWATDFASATTSPEALYGAVAPDADDAARQRADQDQADKDNLLLLLSRGYWSTDFLKTITQAYWDFDHSAKDGAWPGPTLTDAKYAPAPSGAHLSDGILALTAALTANPDASAWAFTDFQPGTETVQDAAGTSHAIGKFSNYLFFEHVFPGGTGDGSVGMTAALTALSSAIDATGGDVRRQFTYDGDGPLADSVVLQDMAQAVQQLADGSILSKVWHATKHAAETAWRWVAHVAQHWGHQILDILSLATFVPPPFGLIGVGAAATNATWYAVEGDYANAGLALAAAVPGLAFGKIVKLAKAGTVAAQSTAAAIIVAARAETVVAPIVKLWRPAMNVAEHAAEKCLGGGPAAQRCGWAAEKAVQGAFSIGRKATVVIDGRTRIFDGLTAKVATEIKNVRYQGYTQQLRDYVAYAEQKGLQVQLFVRGDPNPTLLSGALQDAIRAGRIRLRYIP